MLKIVATVILLSATGTNNGQGIVTFSLSDLPPAGLEMRPDNAAAQLATAQSGRQEAAR
jgi:hypothetical protein